MKSNHFKLAKDFYLQQFHISTKSNHFYGISTLKNNSISFENGILTNALIEGNTFIADEMNISSQEVMKSIEPTLEYIFEEPFYIPGKNKPISIDSKFFFIACQNEIGTAGRNPIPKSIISKFKIIRYPNPNINDLSEICLEIFNKIRKKINKNPIYDDELNDMENQVKKLGEFLIKINDIPQNVINSWSLRDVIKVITRVCEQIENKKIFCQKNEMKIPYNILFYILSPINEENLNFGNDKSIKNKIVNIIVETFFNENERENKKRDLLNVFEEIPKIEKQNDGNEYLMKKDFGISLF